jgi:hypothetical protein
MMAAVPVPVLRFDPLRFTKRIVTGVERHALIAEAAYYRAKHRGFVPGHEMEDWLAAEREVNARVISAPVLPD